MNLPFDTEPFYINEIGTKWWKDEDVQAYLDKEGLDDLKAYFVEPVLGAKQRVIILKDNVVFQTQLLEAVYEWAKCVKLVRKG